MLKSIGQAGHALAWALAGVMAAPFVAEAWAIWALPFGLSPAAAAWVLSLNAALLVCMTAGFRTVYSARAGGLTPSIVGISVVPAAVACGAAVAASALGFHWVFVLLLGALAVQGAWDVSDYAVPEVLRQMRAIVFVAAVLSLLAGLIGS